MDARIVASPGIALLVLLAGCTDAGNLPAIAYDPAFDASSFVDGVDHPYYPLPVGATWVFHGPGGEAEREMTTITVTDQEKHVMGVRVTVVRDTVEVGGEVLEDTYDWFAQDQDGNVWYMGEDSTEYEDGATSKAGSWEAGVDGAEPGIVMPADPDPEQGAYRQEWYEGEAEDVGMVVATDRDVEVPYGTFDEVVEIAEWDPLESDRQAGSKFFARGVGMVLETEEGDRVELVSYSTGGGAG